MDGGKSKRGNQRNLEYMADEGRKERKERRKEKEDEGLKEGNNGIYKGREGKGSQ